MQIRFHESPNHVSYRDKKRKLVPASFSYFLELLREKNKF